MNGAQIIVFSRVELQSVTHRTCLSLSFLENPSVLVLEMMGIALSLCDIVVSFTV